MKDFFEKSVKSVSGGAAKLYHTTRAFAALLRNGSVCAWGELSCGGDSTPAERELEGEKALTTALG